MQREEETCESTAELQTLSRHTQQALLAAQACAILQLSGARLPNADPLAPRLQAGLAPLLTCLPAAAAAAAAAAHRMLACESADDGRTAAEGVAAVLANTMRVEAVKLLDSALNVSVELARALWCRNPHMDEAAGRLCPSASQLLTPAAVASFCIGMQQTLGSLSQLQQMDAAAPPAASLGGGAHITATAWAAAVTAAKQALWDRLQRFAACLFSMAQLVPPGGPAWQLIDRVLSRPVLTSTLSSLLADVADGLEESFSVGGEPVAHTPAADAGCVLLAAVAVEARLRELLSALQLGQHQPGPTDLQRAAANQLWDTLEQASYVAATLCNEGAALDTQALQCLPQTWQCQLRVLSAGAALLSLAADAGSSGSRGSETATSWQALGASAASEAAACAAGRWADSLLKVSHPQLAAACHSASDTALSHNQAS